MMSSGIFQLLVEMLMTIKAEIISQHDLLPIQSLFATVEYFQNYFENFAENEEDISWLSMDIAVFNTADG